mmetsp:Transcript_115476/g.246798  ORF Transcript_115476/g.246798 Transcript_115476/m.246798 type:complete len:201 (-) Transcript_115476:945-1547(-)
MPLELHSEPTGHGKVGRACVHDDPPRAHPFSLVVHKRLVAQPEVNELQCPVVGLHHREHPDGALEERLVNAAPKHGTGQCTVGIQEKGKLVAVQQFLVDDPLEEGLQAAPGEGAEAQAQDALEGEGREDIAVHLPDHRKGLLLHHHGSDHVCVHVERTPKLPGAEHDVDVPTALRVIKGLLGDGLVRVVVEAPPLCSTAG